MNKRDIMKELARELAMRRNVFPKWIAAGRLTKLEADERIATMQAAYEFIDQSMTADYVHKSPEAQ